MGIISEIIGYPLGWVMWLAYQIFHNYAISILVFTIITRFILVPITVKQQKSTAAMAAMTPKLDKIKAKYANNQEKMQEEQMKLYSEEGINPMASCLPLLIQFPLLYGIFDVVYRPITHILRISKDIITKATEIASVTYGTEKYFKMRPELYIIESVKSNPDSYAAYPDLVEKITSFDNTLFGFIDLGKTPTLKPEIWNAAAIGLILIPLMSGIFQLAYTIYSQIHQKKINPGSDANATMKSMNIMLYGMPIFSVWLAFSYPAGIGFYWAMSALCAFAQQLILNRIFTPEYVQKLIEKDKLKKKAKKKSGIMERYQKMIEEQQAMQNGGSPVSRASDRISAVSDDDDADNIEVPKLSKSKQKEYERMLINEARRKQAEKYGEEYVESDDE